MADDTSDLAKQFQQLKELKEAQERLNDAKYKGVDIEKKLSKLMKNKVVDEDKNLKLAEKLAATAQKRLDTLEAQGRITGNEYKTAVNLRDLSAEQLKIAEEHAALLADKHHTFKKLDDLLGGWPTKFKDFGRLMLEPLNLLIALAGVAGKVFYDLERGAGQAAKGMGLSRDQLRETEKIAEALVREYTYLGIEAENLAITQSELAQSFGSQLNFTKDTIKDLSLMVSTMGISEQHSAGVLQNFMGIGGLTEKTSVNLIKTTLALSNIAGTNANQVMMDIANASDTTLGFLGGMPHELAAASVEARRMGINIEIAANSARSLVNFQESINAEMEASTLLGRNINLQKARELAFAGKIDDAAKETFKQVKRAGDLDKMNIFQKEALAKAAGLSVTELSNMLATEKQLGTLSTASRLEYERSVKAVKDLNKLDGDSLLMKQQQAEVAAVLKNLFDQLVVSVGSLLLPLVKLASLLIEHTLIPISQWFGQASKWMGDLNAGLQVLISSVIVLGLGFGGVKVAIFSARKAMSSFGKLSSNVIGKIADSFAKKFPTSGLKKATGAMNDLSKSTSKIKPQTGSSIKQLLRNISKGISSFARIPWTALVKAGLILPIISLGISALALSLKLFNDIDWGSVGLGLVTLTALGVAAAVIGTPAVLPFILGGAAGIAALGLSLIPFAAAAIIGAKAMDIAAESFNKIVPLGGDLAIFGLSLLPLAAGMTAVAIVSPAIFIASVALGALGVALIPLSKTVPILSDSFKTFGRSLADLRHLPSSISNVASSLKDLRSISNPFTSLMTSDTNDYFVTLDTNINKLIKSVVRLKAVMSTLNMDLPSNDSGVLGSVTTKSESGSSKTIESTPSNREVLARLDKLINIFEEDKFNVYIDRTKLIGALQTID